MAAVKCELVSRTSHFDQGSDGTDGAPKSVAGLVNRTDRVAGVPFSDG